LINNKVDFALKIRHFLSRMVFGKPWRKIAMQSKSSTPTLLIVVLIICTFPFWIGLAAGMFGIVAGVFGAVIGIIAGVFGAVFGAIGGIFGLFFDWDWPFDGFFHWNLFPLVILVLIVLLLTRSRRI
jgi:hypothetical protein